MPEVPEGFIKAAQGFRLQNGLTFFKRDWITHREYAQDVTGGHLRLENKPLNELKQCLGGGGIPVVIDAD